MTKREPKKQPDRTAELHGKLDSILKDPKYGETFGKVVDEVYGRLRLTHQKK